MPTGALVVAKATKSTAKPVSPGIKPGYIIFPSHKVIMYSLFGVLLSYKKLEKFLAVRQV
jgi:hypothetical protein